jgi:hypothetical protein
MVVSMGLVWGRFRLLIEMPPACPASATGDRAGRDSARVRRIRSGTVHNDCRPAQDQAPEPPAARTTRSRPTLPRCVGAGCVRFWSVSGWGRVESTGSTRAATALDAPVRTELPPHHHHPTHQPDPPTEQGELGGCNRRSTPFVVCKSEGVDRRTPHSLVRPYSQEAHRSAATPCVIRSTC